MRPYATDGVSLGSAEEPYESDMTHSYRLTEGRLIRYPLTRPDSEVSQRGEFQSDLFYNGWMDFVIDSESPGYVGIVIDIGEGILLVVDVYDLVLYLPAPI